MTKLTNAEMESRVRALAPHLERADMVGYAAARNTRRLKDALTEYATVRDGLVERYGKPEVDECGTFTGKVSLAFDSPDFAKFAEEIEPYLGISHEVEVFRIGYGHAAGTMSGAELLEIDWMFEEEAADAA